MRSLVWVASTACFALEHVCLTLDVKELFVYVFFVRFELLFEWKATKMILSILNCSLKWKKKHMDEHARKLAQIGMLFRHSKYMETSKRIWEIHVGDGYTYIRHEAVLGYGVTSPESHKRMVEERKEKRKRNE